MKPISTDGIANRISGTVTTHGDSWGAWELAARYSDVNLNSHANDTSNVIANWTSTASRTYTYYNTVRGGDQKIVTVGVNWYPNAAVRFAFDYQWIAVSRLQSPAAVTTAGTPSLPSVARSDAYSWAQLQRLVDAASRAGIGVVPIVVYGCDCKVTGGIDRLMDRSDFLPRS